MFLCDLTDSFKRLDGAVFIVDVHDRNQHCGVADCVTKLFNANPSVSIDWKVGYLETALLQIVTGMQNSVMLYRGGDDMVTFTSALLQLGQSLDGVIICLSAAPCEDDFTRTFGTDEFGDLFACGVNRGACFASVGVNAGAVTECFGQIWHHRVPDFGTEWCCSVVIEIDAFHVLVYVAIWKSLFVSSVIPKGYLVPADLNFWTLRFTLKDSSGRVQKGEIERMRACRERHPYHKDLIG